MREKTPNVYDMEVSKEGYFNEKKVVDIFSLGKSAGNDQHLFPPARGYTCPSQRGYESCTNRSATVPRSSDTMRRLRRYKLQPGKAARGYRWHADSVAGTAW